MAGNAPKRSSAAWAAEAIGCASMGSSVGGPNSLVYPVRRENGKLARDRARGFPPARSIEAHHVPAPQALASVASLSRHRGQQRRPLGPTKLDQYQTTGVPAALLITEAGEQPWFPSGGVGLMQEKSGLSAAQEYWIDAWQRGVLLLDALNERGNTYLAQAAKDAPHVLQFGTELVRDGRTLQRPVNYALVRIVPPAA